MKRFGLFVLCLCCTLAVLAAALLSPQAVAQTPPAATTAPAASDVVQISIPTPAPKIDSVENAVTLAPSSADSNLTIRVEAMTLATEGKFTEALAKYEAQAREFPDDKNAPVAVDLLKSYLGRLDGWKADQNADFEQAARRVEYCLVAQGYQPTLAEKKIDKKLRDQVIEVVTAYAHGAAADALEDATVEKAAQLKTKALEALDKSQAALPAAVEMMKDDSSEYGKLFGKLAADLGDRLQGYRKAWAAVDTTDTKSIRATAKPVKGLEEGLAEAVDAFGSIVAEQPWRNGLYQARLARLVAPKAKMDQYDWYRKLVDEVKGRGDDAIKNARWYDALNVYSSLQELDPDDAAIKATLKNVRRHARVLGLYGAGYKDPNAPVDPNASGKLKKQDPNAPQDANAGKKLNLEGDTLDNPAEGPVEDETRWRDMVEGVDADIVNTAIEQLDEHYVTAVDYRKVATGALDSIKVLAETVQATASFPGLADDAKRKAFIAAINRELDNVQKNDHVDHLSLELAFNGVLRESERTVNIPLAVLAVEFTDGILDELDKFSNMVWPHDVDEFKKSVMGEFFGVGIQIAKDPGEPLRVVAPLPDTPAYREGIKTGDVILAVDGKRTEPLPVDKLVRMITGPKGTKVVLTVKSSGQGEPKDVTLIRDEIKIKTIKGWRHEPGGDGAKWDFLVDKTDKIAYIRLAQFTDTTPADLDRVLAELGKEGVHSLILDLREDPGGLLDSAKKVVEEFISSGRIVSTRGRQNGNAKVYDATSGGRFINGDLVVLANDHSASASEITAGALKDWRRAIIVGQRTFGKGSVQNVIQIPKHNAYLKLTTAHYYLPSGRLLHRENGSTTWGVDPDVDVLTAPRQTKRWFDLQRKTDLLADLDPNELSAELQDLYNNDFQLVTAVTILKLMQLEPVKAVDVAAK